MVGERLVGLLLAAGRAVLAQGLGDLQVHGIALVQTDRLVDHVARDAVLEAQRALLLARKDQILLGQRQHHGMVLAAAGDAFEQQAAE